MSGQDALRVTVNNEGMVEGVERVSQPPATVTRLPITETYTTYAAQLEAAVVQFDDQYQRAYRPAWSRKIARTFRGTKEWVIHVSKRADGTYWVMDGQHRIKALGILGRLHEKVTCLVYTGLSREQEAQKVDELNQGHKLAMVDLLRTRKEAGDRETLDFLATISMAGFYISGLQERDQGERAIAAIHSAQWLYEMGGSGVLRETLELIRLTWPSDPDGTKRDSLRGVGQLVRHCAAHRVPINRLHFKAMLRLKPIWERVQEGWREGAGEKKANRSAWGLGMARVLRREYNKNLGNIPAIPPLRVGDDEEALRSVREGLYAGDDGGAA